MKLNDQFCIKCGLRLSKADNGQVCMFCVEFAAYRLAMRGRRWFLKVDALGRKLCRCGALVAYNNGKCKACSVEASRRARRRRAEAQAYNSPL